MTIDHVPYNFRPTSAWWNGLIDAINATDVGAVDDILDAITPTAWTAPTLVNSWVDFGSGYQVAQYRKVGDIVYLRGIIKTGSSGTTAFTLPAGFRPPASIQVAQPGGAAFAYLEIGSTGPVIPTGGSVATSCSLSCQFSVT